MSKKEIFEHIVTYLQSEGYETIIIIGVKSTSESTKEQHTFLSGELGNLISSIDRCKDEIINKYKHGS